MPSPSLPRFFAAAEPHRLAVLKALWPVVAGDAIANHSEVVGIQGEVLRVRANSNSWLKTLRDLKGTLILRLQGAAGAMAPRALAFVEGPLSAKPTRTKPRGRIAAGPVSDLPETIREAAHLIPTQEGQKVYLRAAAAFRTRFKPAGGG
jgi:hypothetical protein